MLEMALDFSTDVESVKSDTGDYASEDNGSRSRRKGKRKTPERGEESPGLSIDVGGDSDNAGAGFGLASPALSHSSERSIDKHKHRHKHREVLASPKMAKAKPIAVRERGTYRIGLIVNDFF